MKKEGGWKQSRDGILTCSIYTDQPAQPAELEEAITNLRNAFPKTELSICTQLLRLAVKTGISKAQFADAVDNFILSHRYATFTVADILSYDIEIRLYSRNEVMKECGSFGMESDLALFPRYGKVNGVPYRIRMSDVQQLPPHIREKVKQRIEQNKQ